MISFISMPKRPRLAVLHAYRADDVTVQLYNSNQNSSRDSLTTGFPFGTPTVINGQVYVAVHGKIEVFGLL